MFVRTETRRSWLSHLFSSQLCRVFLLITIFSSHHAKADPLPTPTPALLDESSTAPTNFDQASLQRNKNSPINTAPFKLRPNDETNWSDFFQNLHGSYEVSFMGPRIAGSGNETYNIFIPDVAPLQLSHYWQLGEQVNPNLQLGLKISGIQNISDGVVGTTGIIRGRSFELYDLDIYANLPNLVQPPGWFVFTTVSMSLSTSNSSQLKGRITELTFDQTWTVANYPSDWTFGIPLEIQPAFFTNPFPANLAFRKTFYASFGHLISYRVSPIVNIQSTSQFDFAHRALPDGSGGTFDFNSNLPDTSRLSLYINPVIGKSVYLSLSGFFQFLVWAPSFETSILGADLTISF